MKLYGLRDDQGRDVELVISDEGHPHHHVLRVEVLNKRSCENCKYGDDNIFTEPCLSCSDNYNYPNFELATPTKGK
jgi:hypothetical protein